MHTTLDLSELNSKIGRLFIAGIPEPQLDPETEALIRDYNLGGVILFNRNIKNPVQLAELCNDLQEMALKYHGTPLFLAVDQEGGPVSRFKKPFTRFPGNTAIGEDQMAVDRAAEFARVTSKEMRLVGLNMNMAPVVDVQGGQPEKHLAGRMFCDDPEKVALLGQTVVREFQANRIMAVAKHFPGLGKSPLDPHHDLPTIDADFKEIEEIDLPPFRAVIMEDVCAIMTSHAIYPALDPDLPATISEKVLTGLLRENLGFQGLIITDDLEMGAIGKKWGTANGAAAAFKAGADILLICKDQNLVSESLNMLRGKLIKGEIPFQRLEQSVERIMKLKSRFLKKIKKVSLEEVREYFGLFENGNS